KLLPTTTRLLDETTPGPRTAPASPPTRSTRLAAPRRRRPCGSGMGSRVLTTLSESGHDLYPAGRALCCKSQTTNGGLYREFEVGCGRPFLKSGAKRRLIRRAIVGRSSWL